MSQCRETAVEELEPDPWPRRDDVRRGGGAGQELDGGKHPERWSVCVCEEGFVG